MVRQKLLSRIFNILFPFTDFLYILQLEEYETKRYLKWLPRFFFRRNIQVRDRLVLTKRVQLILIMSVLLWVISFLYFGRSWLIPIWLICIPLFVLVANVLSTPYFEYMKGKIRKRAAQMMKAFPTLTIVIVAGSLGKTTVKNYIYQLVCFNYRTQMIPGNINTAAGIAEWLLNKFQSRTQLLIVEADTYGDHEIEKICQMVPPHIAVLTNIGDQHLERFKSKRNLRDALVEVFTCARPDAILVTTFETGKQIASMAKLAGRTLHTTPDDNAALASDVAEYLNIPQTYIKDSLQKLELPDRRQKLTEMFGYEAIDDSYNISFTSALRGVDRARRQADLKGKKLLVITAGIPELSAENSDKNRELGRSLKNKADFVLILGSIFAKEIAYGVGDSAQYEIVASLADLVIQKNTWDTSEWLLLMQPELTDLYY
jgi:UDP-N-acetylmuramoyl-tripeptide--D-alanyl-D-alanine ligase